MPSKQSYSLSHFAPSSQLLQTLALANGQNHPLNATDINTVFSNAQNYQNQLQKARVAAQRSSTGRLNLIKLAQQRQEERKAKALGGLNAQPGVPRALTNTTLSTPPPADPSPPPLGLPNQFSPSFVQDKENSNLHSLDLELESEAGAACSDDEETMPETRSKKPQKAETISARRKREAKQAAKNANEKSRTPKHKNGGPKPKSPANGVVHPPTGAPVLPKAATKKVGGKNVMVVDPKDWQSLLDTLQAQTKETDALASRNEQLEEILGNGGQYSVQGSEDIEDDDDYTEVADSKDTKMTPELQATMLKFLQLQQLQQQQGGKKIKLEDGTALQLLPKAPASNKSEERMGDMVDMIHEAVEKFAFRRFKFIENEKQLRDACTEALKWIVQRNDIEVDFSHDQFFEIYSGSVSGSLSYFRNYVVSELKKKHKGKSCFEQWTLLYSADLI